MKHRVSIYSRFSSNSEAHASELLENREEMFTRYFNGSTVWTFFIKNTRPERVNTLQVVSTLYFVKRRLLDVKSDINPRVMKLELLRES